MQGAYSDPSSIPCNTLRGRVQALLERSRAKPAPAHPTDPPPTSVQPPTAHLVGQQEGEAICEGRLCAAARRRPVSVHHPAAGVALCWACCAARLAGVSHQAAGQAQVAGPPGSCLGPLVCEEGGVGHGCWQLMNLSAALLSRARDAWYASTPVLDSACPSHTHPQPCPSTPTPSPGFAAC